MATPKGARPTELKVKVVSAKNLIAADSNGKSDPFAVVYTKSGSSGKDKSIKTKKISETLNPTWNETFNLILRDRKDTLVIEVWDDDLFGKDHLGTAEIPLEGLEHEKETPLVAKLNKQGDVSVALTIRYNDKEVDELHQKQEEERKRLEAQKKKEEDDKRIALEAQKKKEEDERRQKEEQDRKKKEEEQKKAAEEQKKKEEEQKKAQQAQAAKTTAAPAASPAQTPATSTPAKATTTPAQAPASSTPAAKPATPSTSTPATQQKTTASSSASASKPTTKQVEGPNYVLIGGVVAVLAVAGFAAFKYFGNK